MMRPHSTMEQRPTSLGALKRNGYVPRTVKAELRANLIARIKVGKPLFPDRPRRESCSITCGWISIRG
jgi:hypothetical protein